MNRKNIVITGGTKGIGAAIAYKFASEGFDIAICARNEYDLEQLSLSLQNEYGIHCLYKVTDLTQTAEVRQFGQMIIDKWGYCDALVNNAGIFKPGSLLDEPEGTLEKMLAVNTFAPFVLTRILAPAMIKRNKGHIFTISSIAGLDVSTSSGSYVMSKFATTGFSKLLREELKSTGVKVTTVYPGATFTASWEGSYIDPDRILPPEDIAHMIYAVYDTAKNTNVEEIVIRPAKGDL
jgi:short-subunit dehydrogenase